MGPMIEVGEANALLQGAGPERIVRWAVDTFAPGIAMSSSFQTQSLPLLHIVSRVAPGLPVLFLDTGYHFPETLAFRDRLVRDWGLEVTNLRRRPSERPATDLYRTDPDLCCHIHKVEPMRLATRDLDAWISGIRRDQSATRSGISTVEATESGLVRVHPLADWTSHDVFRYIADHDLPVHPLFSEGYVSVGCAPCTRPVTIDAGERSGRWAGQDKTECGLHLDLRDGSGSETPETKTRADGR